MKVLHVSDTHLGADRWFRGAPKGWRRSDDHRDALRRALAPALAQEVDLVVHSGDLFDRSRPPARAVAEAKELLAEVGRITPVLIMPGNHDRRGLRGHLGDLGRGVRVCDTPERVQVHGLEIAMVPFLPEARLWAVAAHAVGQDADLLVAHQAFHGAHVPGFTFRVGAEPDTVGVEHLPTGVRHILCGHIHPRQVLRLGDTFVVNVGSIERTAFSERAQPKGAALWEFGLTARWRFVDLPSRPMVVVRDEPDLDDVVPGALVRMAPDTSADLDAVALARGGWVAPRPAVVKQVALFG